MRVECILLVVAGLLAAHNSCADDWARVLKDAIAHEGKLEFYGKVEDQDGRPVKDIDVLYRASSAGFPKPIYKKGRVKTDSKGLFTVKGGHVGILYFDGIEKQGYELVRRPESFDYRQDYRYRHRPDRDKPVVFQVRRKDHEGTHILKSGMGVELSMEERNGRDGKRYGRDFAVGLYYSINRQPDDWERERAFWDIEATGEADVGKGVWNVTLKTNGEKSGIQRLDTLLYAVPDKGYSREIALTVPFGIERLEPTSHIRELSIRHFYARLREPGMYARLDVEEISANEKELLISCKVIINPYGGRSFEELTFLWQRLSDTEKNKADTKLRNKIKKSFRLEIDDCDKPATQAMREQRFAERPPFDEWMKDGLVFW